MDQAATRFERRYDAQDRILEAVETPLGTAVVYTARAPRKDTDNEDAAAVIALGPDRLVLAVGDGVGGLPAGQEASALALASLSGALAMALQDTRTLREAILSGFDRANHAVMDLGSGAATTLAVAELEGRQVRSYHVGDSGVLLFGGRGKVKLQTIFHSPVGYALEAGVMDEREAIEHEDRHVVSNVIGDRDMHVGMSSRITLRPRDTLVIASDGLFDNCYTEEIVEALRRGRLLDAVERLVGQCAARMEQSTPGLPGKPDDLTVLAFRPAARIATRSSPGP